MARRVSWRPWRRRQQPPAWPTPQAGRPTWAAEQQQMLPAVRPAIEPVIRECGDMR